jgi:hypothetical protein
MSAHDYYVRCSCDALYSNPIEKCPACGKANPDLKAKRDTDRASPPPPAAEGK